MAWAVDQANIGSADGGAGGSTTVAFNTTATVASGAWIFLVVGHWISSAVTVASVSGGGLTWTVVGEQNNANTRVALVRAYAPSGLASGTTITATYSASSTFRFIGGASFSGGVAGSVVENMATATGSGTAHSVSPSSLSSGALAIQVAHTNTGASNTPDANSTEAVELAGTGGGAQGGLLQYRIGGAAGTQTVGGTFSGSAAWSSVGATISLTEPAIYLAAESATPTGTATGTATASPLPIVIPSAVQAGDKILLLCGLKPSTATFTTPTGYTLPTNGDLAGGGGTTGADTGPTKAAVFERTADGSEGGTTVNITLGSTPNSATGKALVFRKADASATWDVACANGADSTTGTPFTATMGSDPGFAVDDMAVVLGVIPTDVTTPAQFSSPTLTATGLTVSLAENSEPETTQGNDLGGVIALGLVTGGPSSTAPTFSATAGGTTTNVRGPIIVTRLRAVTAAAPAVPWLVMPPPVPA